MDFDLSGRSEAWLEKLQAFFDQEVLPRHRAWLTHVAKGEAAPFMGDLQRKARAAGLWNLCLPELADDEPGTRLSNLEYAPLAEIMGRLFWAPEVFNCQAPDVPNMIALQNCATSEQKARWLQPLLEARTRSAFGMTEPDVASSDATNIATRMVRDGDDYVINGRKWFITGAAHPRCSFLIVMGVTDSGADRTGRHSCIIVPMETPGVRLVRRLRWMGCEDHVAPIGELAFDNVRVPRANLLGAEGEGFKLALRTLDIFRASVAAAALGFARRAADEALSHAKERPMFGGMLADLQLAQAKLAEMAVAIDAAALLTYRAAWLRDVKGVRTTKEAAMAKWTATESAQEVIDAAVQMFGALGVTRGQTVERLYREIRALRIYEGATDVQKLVVARELLRR